MNRRGVTVAGTISGGRERVAWWTRHFFDKGWRQLEVTIDGDVVGRIEQHPDTRRRTWWAEDAVRR